MTGMSDARKADLVLEGGGVKGIGLLGAIQVLDEQGYSFPRIAGTSAGAIVGTLTAAYQVAGKPLGEIADVMRELDYRALRDGVLLDRLGPPGKAIELMLTQGVYKGEFIVEWLSEQLAGTGVRTWGDLRIDDDPDTSLPKRQRYRLVVMASDLSRGQLVRLPWDFHHYGLEPDSQSIVDSVRASMSIPFYYRPITLATGPSDGGHVTLVDGGMLSNFPVDAFDRIDGKPPRWPTFGIKLSARPDSRQIARDIDGTADLLLGCLHTLLDAHDAYHLEDEGVTQRTIFVDTARVKSTDFDIDTAQQQRLYENGRAAATKFLAARPARSQRHLP
jgi:NTE family protein